MTDADAAARDALAVLGAAVLPTGPLEDALARLAPDAVESLAAAAERHGLSGVLLEGLTSRGLTLPSPWHERLGQVARQLLRQSSRLKRLTFECLERLEARGVEAVVLKGPLLAARTWPSPHLRPSVDVDLLVSPAELDAAVAALAGAGFALEAGQDEASHHLALSGPRGLVEVHHRLGTGLETSLHPQRHTVVLEGRRVNVLTPEVEFTSLSAHAAGHAFVRASWLVDLAYFMATPLTVDWARCALLARCTGNFTAVAAALDALERLLRLPVPPAARAAFALSPARQALLTATFTPARLLAGEPRGGDVRALLARLALADGAGDAGVQVWRAGRRWFRGRAAGDAAAPAGEGARR